MTKFKAGDKVRMVQSRNFYGDEGYGHEIGSIQIITCIDNDLKHNDFVAWKVEGGGWVRSDDIELVEDRPMLTPEYSCIRVVPPSKPKREIVEGFVKFDGGASLTINNGGDNDVIVGVRASFFTSKALREAATLFTTLAEVLEENENA